MHSETVNERGLAATSPFRKKDLEDRLNLDIDLFSSDKLLGDGYCNDMQFKKKAHYKN